MGVFRVPLGRRMIVTHFLTSFDPSASGWALPEETMLRELIVVGKQSKSWQFHFHFQRHFA